MSELKPCPRCKDGGKPEVVQYGNYSYEVECQECYTSTMRFINEDDAVESWNMLRRNGKGRGVELGNKPRDFFKHRRCKKNGGHEYVKRNEYFVNCGMGKIIEYRCARCGHEKVEVI